MPAFDFTPIMFGLAGAIFCAFATACVTTTDGRSFLRIFGQVSAICGGSVLLAGLAAWAVWGVYFA